jgi:acetyltransferase-like isoleucine patch superfamily enzyme
MGQPPLLSQIRSGLRPLLVTLRRVYLIRIWGMSIGSGTRISLRAHLDLTNPKGVKIGRDTTVTFGTAILAHDPSGGRQDTQVGDCCFIGVNSIIFPGITIGDHCVISAGSVVVQDVPANSWVGGNPARVIESGIQTGPGGIRIRH